MFPVFSCFLFIFDYQSYTIGKNVSVNYLPVFVDFRRKWMEGGDLSSFLSKLEYNVRLYEYTNILLLCLKYFQDIIVDITTVTCTALLYI